jgi:DNA segregation ATPase FtsK/SpoIIIE, S-DNA-T family
VLISLIKKERIVNFSLPERVNGNYWITNVDNNNIEENFINIEATEGTWKLISNIDVEIIQEKDNMEFSVPFVMLELYKLYTLQNKKDNSRCFLYTLPTLDNTNKCVSLPQEKEITIGKNSECNIVYQAQFIKDIHAKLVFDNVKYTLVNSSGSGIYVNNKPVLNSIKIFSGDVIFILGLKIIIIYDKQGTYMIINNPNNSVSFNDTVFRPRVFNRMPYDVENEEDNIDLTLYSENDYFHKKPRFMKLLEEVNMNIDAPPGKENDKDQNLLLTIGPMITTGMTSMVTMYSSLNNIFSKNASVQSTMPSLVIAGSMLLATMLWPTLTKFSNKREKKSRERLRQRKYQQYIEDKRKLILEKMKEQEAILNEKFFPLTECETIIHEKNMKLWERKLDEADFLECSLGYGTMPMKINIKYPEEHFSLEDDILKKMVTNLGEEKKDLVNVPITISLFEKYIIALIGEHIYSKKLIDNMLFQLFTFHSYDELKIVILTNKDKEVDWQDYKICPYIWDDSRTVRYYADTPSEIKEICFDLDKIYQSRTNKENERYKEMSKYNPHYLIITDVFKNVRNQDFIKHVLEQTTNKGFSLLILNDSVSSLPNECKNFINTSNETCEVYENVLNNESIKFKIDFESNVDFYEAFKILANTPLEINRSNEAYYPDKIGFLEMYGVGKIEQLNPLERWRVSNPILSLSAPIGAGKNGEVLSLDLHENYHGPHGLIAGMTGSGKSEFIITYILSMAINYHPEEVQFILIDYKGGGLAGAFEKSEIGIKLPHLAGTITNLDANEINRSLSSIQSELKRRQKIFNDARTLSGESTIDIYKYQKLYRDKIVTEPVSHLFIISDEFAELKQQQPDFMQQLISTARIGRSLGVHLILATQKPSGVVDNQIWSNTRFRVCLRVQEKSDSTEVIKCPDAALLKQTGRFYLQVGYNEIFELGQAAYAGGQYVPSEKLKKTVNTDIDFINNIGTIYENVNIEKKNLNVKSLGEELTNIVKYLDSIAKEENINARRLWLDRIKEYINIKDTINKYKFTKTPYSIDIAIGEYDDPTNQEQHILTVPLGTNGNAIIYGSTGSGKENLLTTLLYSGIITYPSSELNYYIIDFGAESLRSFSKYPHVGDVILVNDTEKFNNLFKMLNSFLETRKQLFVDYNGEYQYYCKKSGKIIPAIVVIINNFESYIENYPNNDEELIQLTREGAKYGIYFILSASNANTVKSKIKQNFGQDFVLQMNNEMDYSSILGSVGKNYPSKIFGRGIIKKSAVYEFQTAFVAPREEIVEFIREEAEKYASDPNMVKATKVPVLPNIVSYDNIRNEYSNTKEIIIGIDKAELLTESIDYTRDTISLIAALDYANFTKFINPFINQIISKNLFDINVVECEDIKLNPKYNKFYKYYKSEESLFLTDLENTINEKYLLYEQNNKNNKIFENNKHSLYIIVGINTLLEKSGKAKEFGELVQKAKELGIFNFIFVDIADKIKKIEIETWYKENVKNNYGIWLGDGVADQYTIKLMRVPRELREEIPQNFCYVIKNGKTILVKFVENFELNC